MAPFSSRSRLPKYVQLADQLRAQVAAGEMRPGDQLPTFAEMRERYNLGQRTLEKMHELLEQEGLIERRRGSGIFVAQPKPKVATGFIGLAGLLPQSKQAPYWMSLLAGVHQAAEDAEEHVLLLKNAANAGGWDQIDGVLIATAYYEEILQRIPDELPRVVVLCPTAGQPNVLADDEAGSRDATRHLLSLGHRRIALFTTTGPLGAQRIAGYRAALGEHNIEPDERWMRCVTAAWLPDSYVERGEIAMRNWLAEDWKKLGCTAILAQNDETAVGAIGALRAAGLEVPRQVSVVGFDDTSLAQHFSPSLTSVRVPLHEIGALSTRLLIHQIQQGRGENQTVVLPARLQVRDSTAPPPD